MAQSLRYKTAQEFYQDNMTKVSIENQYLQDMSKQLE